LKNSSKPIKLISLTLISKGYAAGSERVKVKHVSDFDKKILSLKQLTDLGSDCIYTTAQAYLRKQEDPSIMIPLQMKEDGMFYLRVKKIETANTTTDKDDKDEDMPILRKQPKWGINTNEMDVNLAHKYMGPQKQTVIGKDRKGISN